MPDVLIALRPATDPADLSDLGPLESKLDMLADDLALSMRAFASERAAGG